MRAACVASFRSWERAGGGLLGCRLPRKWEQAVWGIQAEASTPAAALLGTRNFFIADLATTRDKLASRSLAQIQDLVRPGQPQPSARSLNGHGDGRESSGHFAGRR